MATALPIIEVVYDPSLQQRAVQVEPVHLKRLLDALETGAMFPAIIIDKASRRIVDGIHRYHAIKKYAEKYPEKFNGEVTILCEEREFFSDDEMFKFVLAANSAHGMPWAPIDKQRITLEAQRRGISLPEVSELIRMPLPQLEKVSATAIVRPATDGELRKEPLKNTLPKTVREAWAGKVLTTEQQDVNNKFGGMRLNYYIENLTLYLKADCWKLTDEPDRQRFRELQQLLTNAMQDELAVR
jgi:hypothetical protein